MKTKHSFAAIIMLSTLFPSACRQQARSENKHIVRADFRFGNGFYSLCSKETGESYVIKGTCTDYNQPFNALSSDTSGLFMLDSAKIFLKSISELKSKPFVITRNSDAPRVEIYYDEKKVYDSHKWDSLFWEIFKPVMMQMPKGFNPFLGNDKPFG